MNMSMNNMTMSGGSMEDNSNKLLQLNQCSPLMVYFVMVVGYGILLYSTRNDIDKINESGLDKVFQMDMTYELVFLALVGVLIYGTCRSNKELISWIILLVPVALLGCKIVFVFSEIPKYIKRIEEVPINMYNRVRGKPLLSEPIYEEEDTYEDRLRAKQPKVDGMRPPLQLNQSKASSISSLGYGGGSGSPNEAFAKF